MGYGLVCPCFAALEARKASIVKALGLGKPAVPKRRALKKQSEDEEESSEEESAGRIGWKIDWLIGWLVGILPSKDMNSMITFLVKRFKFVVNRLNNQVLHQYIE
jgi:hypothetical protein